MKGQPDVEQLRGLIEAAKALDIVPFDEHELTTANDSRFDDLWEVLDRASYKLFDITLPAQRDGIFVVWRYVAVGAFDAFFTVGIGRRERTDAEPWIWVKILNDSHLGRASQEVAKRLKPDAVVDEDGLAFPLLLEPGYSGVELEESIRDQLEKIAIQIRDGISESLSKAGDGAGRSELPYSLTGMPAFAAEDLLDSSRQRRDDIVALVREAGRGFVTGRFRMQRSEPFESRFWIQVDPYKTHLSVGVGRTDESTVPRPWAWISVHESTPNRDVAYKALEERFQGEVKGIPNGRGLPLRIPDGVSAGDAFSSVVMQIETAKLAIRAALKAMEA
jgi:hypothetical protein